LTDQSGDMMPKCQNSQQRPAPFTDNRFRHELGVMTKTVRRGLNAFYTSECLDELWKEDELVRRKINQNQELWVAFKSGLQADYVLVLHRLLDNHPNTQHSLTKFLRKIYNNPQLFSKEALEKRKMIGDYRPEHLTDYMVNAWTFNRSALGDLDCQLAKYRCLYERDYRDLRNQVFAHIGTIDERRFDDLVARTNVKTLEEMFLFMWDLVRQLQDLFENGNKPAPDRFNMPNRNEFRESVRSIFIQDDVYRRSLPT